MKLAMVAVVGLGLLAAISASVLVRTLATKSPATEAQGPAQRMVDVLVAKKDLPALSVITGDAVTVTKVRAEEAPEHAATNSVQVVGRVLMTPVVAGEAFSKRSFARAGDPVHMATALPQGMRAVSVQLTDWSGMAGLLYPGSVVDVLVTFRPTSGGGDYDDVSTTLLQGLQVLAVGSQSVTSEKFEDRNPGAMATRGQVNTRMITLLVNPKQAQILQLAVQNGNVALAMRNPLDTQRLKPQFIRTSEIQSEHSAAEPELAGGVDDESSGLVLALRSWMRSFSNASLKPATRPSEQLAAGTSDSTIARPSLWEMLIIRGERSETRTFRMPVEKTVDIGGGQSGTSSDARVRGAVDGVEVH
jgi:pilus assembly protein CpaB